MMKLEYVLAVALAALAALAPAPVAEPKRFAESEIQKAISRLDYAILQANLDLIRHHLAPGIEFIYPPPRIDFDDQRRLFTSSVMFTGSPKSMAIAHLQSQIDVVRIDIRAALERYLEVTDEDIEIEVYTFVPNADPRYPGYRKEIVAWVRRGKVELQ